MTSPFPRPDQRLQIVVDAADPFERGADRGRQLRDTLPGTIDAYDRLFRLGGIDERTVRDDAERLLDAIGAHRPALRTQIEGIASGADAELWRVAALNGRTEILSRSVAVPPGECSTIVRSVRDAEGRAHALGVQTWDWHMEIAPYWHTVVARGGAHDYAGLTECGILGKIGVNSAGVALHFNILGHRSDRPEGVPMHVLAALVLEEATSVAHAVDLVRTAPVTSSGSFALFDADGDAALLDISPEGVFEAPAVTAGTWLRTNHFLTAEPAAEEKTWLYQPDSGERWDFLRERLARGPARADAEQLRAALITGEGEPPVTCVPDLGLPMGQRWASLATVVLDPAARRADILDGTPAENTTRPHIELTV
ncbi:C45 family autoproteolytic acyltransferase/hydolase [Microbacterium arabinogalactanolyticum]|uniref:C45 family autoproteolytic acyltransferase/hydolase n=1 Tax=Microbacterium arabinogalactanolyticum TaxID=69365 RepID=UPI00255790B7|nr:C45 family peptidase [Microbacterium arabinogalactanolyticum]GLC85640.1 acyl-CoA--6-aminopenicillanic acid acyl-transferase [Microbacterium arabinogalactanolyticum]